MKPGATVVGAQAGARPEGAPRREDRPHSRSPDTRAPGPQQDPGEPTERRRLDRRNGDRRQQPRLDSEFEGAASSAEARRALAADTGPGAEGEGHAARQRILRLYLAARVAVAVAWVGVQGIGAGLGLSTTGAMNVVAWLYAAQVVTVWVVPRLRALVTSPNPSRGGRVRWLLTVGADLIAFLGLHAVQADVGSSYTALLVLPVLMAGVLSSRVVALGTAAAVSLMLLAVGSRAAFGSPDDLLVLARQGFTGIGFFLIALLTSEISARLEREEKAAAGSREQARRQAELNRLVLDEMAEGVLVVDGRLWVRAANPAARLLISGGEPTPAPPFALLQRPCWEGLAQAVESAFQRESWPEAGRALELRFREGGRRGLIVRMRFTRPLRPDGSPGRRGAGAEEHCVLFLEDARTVQARARQDKLAAMGRMSAGIAHEIRNPLAAIAQANQLLGEEVHTPGQQRLSKMVSDNVHRLQRIVEDVLEAASASTQLEATLSDARAEVAAAVADWAAAASEPGQARELVRLDLPPAALPVQFDGEHLRRVLVNLLDNARRHGSGAPGSIQLRLAPRDAASVVISVASDGSPIAPAVERHLFEPFFSTRSRGSGLGLYICRELCERHAASIEYRLKPPEARHRNAFVVVMRRAAGGQGSEVGQT
jgi:two-component system sensor histidine kinase PilS (NtrC family)